jgi:hypothetical protein
MQDREDNLSDGIAFLIIGNNHYNRLAIFLKNPVGISKGDGRGYEEFILNFYFKVSNYSSKCFYLVCSFITSLASNASASFFSVSTAALFTSTPCLLLYRDF